MNKTVHILMGGPIRPTLGYIAKSINRLKKSLHNFKVVTHFVTWTTGLNPDTIEILNCIFDHTYYCKEPTEEEIISRDIQTMQMFNYWHQDLKTKLLFASGYYKLYFSYRQLVNMCKINNDDIVIRIRTDLYIDPKGFGVLNTTIEHCKKNTIYIRPNKHCKNLSDWFAISDYTTFKKTYYIPNDDELKSISEKVFCSEELITYNAKQNSVDVQLIDPDLAIMQICREFKDGIEKLHSYD
jgi:hypothetical protein